VTDDYRTCDSRGQEIVFRRLGGRTVPLHMDGGWECSRLYNPVPPPPTCRACAAGMPKTLPRQCPGCGRTFKGEGWEGTDAHWKARHSELIPYSQMWRGICAGHGGPA